MAIKVKNLNGTSDNTCRCGSWLRHWEKYGGGTATLCSEETCTKKAEVGAHVQKDSNNDQKWYIIPLCQEHNKSDKALTIFENTKFVSANTKETCAKA